MKPLPFKIPKTEQASFRVQVDAGPHFYERFHYHPEWQLTTIHRGRGMLYLGNSFTRFQEGAFFLIGSDIPHLLRNDTVYFSEESPGVYAVSLFFHANSFGRDFFNLPELKQANQLLTAAQRGIQVVNEDTKILQREITKCLQLHGITLFQQLLSVLDILCRCEGITYLNQEAFSLQFREEDGQRLDRVFQFSFQHYERPIELAEIAAIANLSPSQFCRYFRLHTRKTYFQFLNELRVEAACKSLVEQDYTIAQTCYKTGFRNLSNFNRQFKKIKGMTPSDFRRAFRIDKLC